MSVSLNARLQLIYVPLSGDSHCKFFPHLPSAMEHIKRAASKHLAASVLTLGKLYHMGSKRCCYGTALMIHTQALSYYPFTIFKLSNLYFLSISILSLLSLSAHHIFLGHTFS